MEVVHSRIRAVESSTSLSGAVFYAEDVPWLGFRLKLNSRKLPCDMCCNSIRELWRPNCLYGFPYLKHYYSNMHSNTRTFYLLIIDVCFRSNSLFRSKL